MITMILYNYDDNSHDDDGDDDNTFIDPKLLFKNSILDCASIHVFLETAHGYVEVEALIITIRVIMTTMTVMFLDTIANVALANKITKREKAAFSKSVNCTSNGRNSTRHPGPADSRSILLLVSLSLTLLSIAFSAA